MRVTIPSALEAPLHQWADRLRQRLDLPLLVRWQGGAGLRLGQFDIPRVTLDVRDAAQCAAVAGHGTQTTPKLPRLCDICMLRAAMATLAVAAPRNQTVGARLPRNCLRPCPDVLFTPFDRFAGCYINGSYWINNHAGSSPK